MRRYLNMLRHFWATSLAAEMEYRLNFAVAAATATLGLIGSLFGLWLFFSRGGTLGGWTWDQSLVVMGIFTVLEGVSATLLTPNLGRLVSHVRTGTLDFVLLKPIDSQFWLSTRYFSPGGLPDVAFGVIVTGVAAWRLGLEPVNMLLSLAPLATACVVLYSLWFLLATTGIWFVKIYNATEVLRSLLESGRFPSSAYPAAWRFAFTFILPVAFMTTVPARVMLGRGGAAWPIASLGVAVVLFACSRLFWRFALRYYTSASS
ncbi:MAG: ABC transporter permease [Planctomycetes bacterium]|nr:ABC transporter permease [Planctomycetota bacterium]